MPGFRPVEDPISTLLTVDSVPSLGLCPSAPIVTVPGKGEDPVWHSVTRFVYSEVAAIPSDPHEGKEVVLGLAAQPCNVQAALHSAREYLKDRYNWIAGLMNTVLGKEHPYVDLGTRRRLQVTGKNAGKPFAEGVSRHMDLIFHTPPGCNAAFLAPSMILATITMLWKLPSLQLRGWNVVANLTADYNLYGYPALSYHYLQEAKDIGNFDTLLVSHDNAEQLRAAVEDRGETLEGLGMRVIGCSTMDEMVCWAILGKDPAEVVMG